MPQTVNPKNSRSQQLFEAAQKTIPGGVNSPVRAFGAVGGTPIFFDRASGAYMYDADDNRYIDYVLSWGPMLLGHGHETVLQAIRTQLDKAMTFGTPTELEIQLADKICSIVPGMEMIRMVNSGTEATMSAIRLARGYTGRDKIVKFEGCYHGHSDSLLVKAGSGALTLGVPSSPGVPACLADHTITLSYNDIEQVKQVFSEIGDQIACIIVEPVVGNMNCVPPIPGFLEALRECCTGSGALLIIDEVMTGFRISRQGATGQGYRRRHASRCFWWQARHHGTYSTAWACLSGRHTVRQPRRYGFWPSDTESNICARIFRSRHCPHYSISRRARPARQGGRYPFNQ